MNSEQAKEILLGYRPGLDDAHDPRVAEALRQLDQDPDLARWFEQLQRADDAIRRRLRDMPVPADLQQRILAERKITRVDFGWRKPVLIAAAAAMILLGVVSVWVYQFAAKNGWRTYRAEMVAYVSNHYNMYIKAKSFDELRQVLAERKWPTDFTIPDHLQSVTVIGGGAMQWQGHKVALACMKDHSRGLWLFVIEKAALRGAPESETPRVEVVDDMPTATWSRDGNTYLFTVQGDEAFLRKYLP